MKSKNECSQNFGEANSSESVISPLLYFEYQMKLLISTINIGKYDIK